MEHLRRALDLANQGQGYGQARVHPLPFSPRSAPAFIGNITYSQTRVWHASPDVLRERRVLVGNSNSDELTAYGMLRTQVLQRMSANQWNTLAITSPGAGQGKTLTSINLAISLAREVHHTVLLADFDLRNPSIHRYFDFTPECGVSDYLLHDTPLNQALLNPGIERLVILPGREPLFNSSEMLSSPITTQLVSDLKTRYPSRFILFDLPPLLTTDDTLAFTPSVDAVLLVIEEGKTTRDELQHAVALLQHANIIGTVLNKSEETINAYY
jgi:capsular exopolysaccharide synthesis family protein